MRDLLNFKIIIGVVVLGLIILLLNITPLSSYIKNGFYFFSSPVQKFFLSAGHRVSDFSKGIFIGGKLKEESEKLKTENDKLLASIAALKEVENENKSLRGALNIELNKSFSLILSKMVSKDASSDVIVINKGKRDGVKKDMPVVTSERILCGKISDVSDRFSKVMLLSSKDSIFSAKLLEQGLEGVVKGRGDSRLFLDLIPRDKTVSKGDIVVTSEMGGTFPPGLFVGKIDEVVKSDLKPFQEANLAPSCDVKDLEDLFIVTEF